MAFFVKNAFMLQYESKKINQAKTSSETREIVKVCKRRIYSIGGEGG